MSEALLKTQWQSENVLMKSKVTISENFPSCVKFLFFFPSKCNKVWRQRTYFLVMIFTFEPFFSDTLHKDLMHKDITNPTVRARHINSCKTSTSPPPIHLRRYTRAYPNIQEIFIFNWTTPWSFYSKEIHIYSSWEGKHNVVTWKQHIKRPKKHVRKQQGEINIRRNYNISFECFMTWSSSEIE